jgi:hypothetical protein
MGVVHILAAPIQSVVGVPGWVANGASIGTLVMLIVGGLYSSKLWTKRQVDILVKQHEVQMNNTVDVYKGRIEDAIRREGEWRDVATKWQDVAATYADAMDPVQEQSQTVLTIVQEMQRHQLRRGQR